MRTAAVVVAGLGVVVSIVFAVLATGEARPAGAGMSGGVSAVVLSFSALAFAVVGRLVIGREPGNRVGPILSVTGVALSLISAGVYANYAVFVSDPRWPAGAAIVLYNVAGPPAFGLIGV